MVVTLYVFPAGAAPGEAGPLLYYRILEEPDRGPVTWTG
jgi:hypothetical protein